MRMIKTFNEFINVQTKIRCGSCSNWFQPKLIVDNKCKSCKREETLETILSFNNNNFLSKIISYFKK